MGRPTFKDVILEHKKRGYYMMLKNYVAPLLGLYKDKRVKKTFFSS